LSSQPVLTSACTYHSHPGSLMIELILLFIALVTLSLSSEAAVFFCGLAVVVIVVRNRTLKQNFERLQKDLVDQTDALRREIRSTRDALERISARLSE